MKRTEQFLVQKHLRHLGSGTHLISKLAHGEEPTWTKLLLIYAGRSFAKMQTNGGMSLKTQEPAETPDEEVAGEEIGTGDNDIGRNVPFFEIRYPHDEQLVAFAPAGPGFIISLNQLSWMI